MPSDYYSNSQDTGDDAASSSEAGDDSTPDESKTEDSNTTLVSNSFFGDKPLEVGNKCEVEIVHVYDDESEIKYVPHGTNQSSKSSMDEADKSIDDMANEEA